MEEKTLEERIKIFLGAYGKLVEEHKIDFVNYPMYQPNEKGEWILRVQTQPVDTTKQNVKSPFIEKA